MNKHKMMIQVDGETYYHTDHVAKLTGIAHDHGYKTGKDDGYEEGKAEGYELGYHTANTEMEKKRHQTHKIHKP